MAKHRKRIDSALTRTRILRVVILSMILGISWTYIQQRFRVDLPVSSAATTMSFLGTPPSVRPIPSMRPKPTHVTTAPRVISAPTTTPTYTVKPTPTTVKPAPPAPVAPVRTPAVAPVLAGGHASLVSIARSFIGLGIPYLYGGKDPAVGLDCSGFVWVVLKKAGFNVPYRDSSALKSWATPISASSALPGDLVFWPGHVGIYAGPGIVIDDGTPAGPKQSAIWGSPSYGRIPL